MTRPIMTPKVDGITGAAIGMDFEHHLIHAEKSFKVLYEETAPTNVGEETAIGFLTPPAASGLIHFTFQAWANDESILELREDPVIVLDTGLAQIIQNRFRPSANTSGVLNNDAPGGLAGNVSTYNVAQAAAAGLAGGTILHHETLAAGSAPPFASMVNSMSRAQAESVLLPSTEYVLILTTTTINTTTHNLQLNWYEHIPADFAN